MTIQHRMSILEKFPFIISSMLFFLSFFFATLSEGGGYTELAISTSDEYSQAKSLLLPFLPRCLIS